jgi:hypothetical protein
VRKAVTNVLKSQFSDRPSGDIADMGNLFRFIADAIKRSIAGVIITAVMGMLGFTPQFISDYLPRGLQWLTYWQVQLAFYLGSVLAIAFVFYRQIQHTKLEFEPDSPISDAIDYIVNDSIAILRQPPQPYIERDGRRIVHWGVQHSDALAKVNERLNTGVLDASGFRQIKSHIANQFELQKRPIPGSDWLVSQLHPLTSLSNTDKAPQTMAIPGTHASDRLEWTGIMVPMATVKQLWPQQSWARRAWKWILRRPRIEPRAPEMP